MRHSTGHGWRTVAVAAFAAGALAVLLAPATAPAAKGGGKPDLVVKDADRRGKPFYVNNTESSTKVKLRVKNKGKRKSGQTEAGAYIEGGGDVYRAGTESVGGIQPGEDRQVTVDFFRRREVLPAGRYNLRACVDVEDDRVKESNERNNCEKLGRFYVVHQRFVGTLSGREPLDPLSGQNSAAETRDGTGTLSLSDYLGSGIFTYPFSGSVRFVSLGTDSNGCTWSGGGTTTQFDPNLLTILDLEQETYTRECRSRVRVPLPAVPGLQRDRDRARGPGQLARAVPRSRPAAPIRHGDAQRVGAERVRRHPNLESDREELSGRD